MNFNGSILLFTSLKLIPYSLVKVPFRLGRTIRGISFDINLISDPYGKLCLDI